MQFSAIRWNWGAIGLFFVAEVDVPRGGGGGKEGEEDNVQVVLGRKEQ